MQMIQIMENFMINGSIVHAQEYGNGHINKTYLVTTSTNDKYILQQINTNVFKRPREVMENIERVTNHIRKRNNKNSKNDNSRSSLEIISTKDKKNYVKHKDGYWRCYKFIDGAKTYEQITDPNQFYEVGKAIGNFQKQLNDFPIKKLNITIPDFHNTPKRFQKFTEVANIDKYDRGMDVFNEIKFVCDRQKDMYIIVDLLKENKIPLRVTHNDTKLNNVMLDEKTGQAICVIDLDTVMPGSVLYDFGDAIRIGASTAVEDEPNLDKIHIDLELFRLFSKGFLEVLKKDLKKDEINNLVASTKIITLECGMRFLTDYLDGDNYFKIHYDTHNLIRARAQFQLLRNIEAHEQEMHQIIEDIIKTL